MKLKRYTFQFLSGPIAVNAPGEKEAKILAQAEAIRRGWNYEILGPDGNKEG